MAKGGKGTIWGLGTVIVVLFLTGTVGASQMSAKSSNAATEASPGRSQDLAALILDDVPAGYVALPLGVGHAGPLSADFINRSALSSDAPVSPTDFIAGYEKAWKQRDSGRAIVIYALQIRNAPSSLDLSAAGALFGAEDPRLTDPFAVAGIPSALGVTVHAVTATGQRTGYGVIFVTKHVIFVVEVSGNDGEVTAQDSVMLAQREYARATGPTKRVPVAPTTTQVAAPPVPADLATLLPDQAPPGFVPVPSGVGRAGPADVARVASFVKNPDSVRLELQSRGFKRGYFKVWVHKDTYEELVNRVYEFNDPAGARGYADSVAFGLSVESKFTMFPVDIPGATGFVESFSDDIGPRENTSVVFSRGSLFFNIGLVGAPGEYHPADAIALARAVSARLTPS